MHLQGSLHLQLLGTVGPACVVHHTPWLEGIHLSNWQGLGSVACQLGGSTHLSSPAWGMFPCRAQGGDDWQAEPCCHRAKRSDRDRPKLSAEMERIFSSNSVRLQRKEDLKGGEVWEGLDSGNNWAKAQRWEYA